MLAVVQRVSAARVMIDGQVQGSIAKGLLIFLGIKRGDTEDDARYMAEKCSALRIFEDAAGKMNLSIRDVQGSALVVSQFTLYGDTRKGNRPSFIDAAPPEIAEPLYDLFVAHMKMLLGGQNVGTGIFRAMMNVELTNDGPVTLLVESKG